jgi:hypothetical protein
MEMTPGVYLGFGIGVGYSLFRLLGGLLALRLDDFDLCLSLFVLLHT